MASLWIPHLLKGDAGIRRCGMENERYQKELFEFEKPKKQKNKFGQLLQTTNFAVILTAEKIVFLVIGVIMLGVIFFALGVEKGRSLADKASAAAIKTVIQEDAVQVQTKSAPLPLTNTTVDKTIAPAQARPDKDKPYTIVAAAFSRQDFASKEAGHLKASGLESFVYFSDPYYLACVGSFASKESASKLLGKVKQMHRDAYIRLK